MRILVSVILVCSIAMVGCTEAVNQEPVTKNTSPRIIAPQPATENRLPGQYLVTLQEGASADVIKQVFQQYGLKSVQKLSGNRYLISLEHDPGPEAISKQAAVSSDIEAVQPNYVYRAMPPSSSDQPQ